MRKQRIKSKEGVVLAEGQAIALASILDFLESQNRTFALSGYAGTGKTFLTQLILDECDRTKKDYLLTAPTNKAARVLAKTTGKDAITIARMLGLRPKIDKVTGKEIFARDPDAPVIDLDDYDLIILDEASMISAELLEMLSQEFTIFAPKFLFLGDTAQLPPVGEAQSLAFDRVDESANLTEVMRYDGAILNWATALRSQSAIAPPSQFVDDEKLITLSDRAFAEKIVQGFTSSAFTENTDYCRVLAWTNACVNQWNQKIRGAIFGKKAPRFMPGERLVATGVCTQRQIDNTGKVTESVILPSSEEISA
jgi:exodeoxyribonuclease-5